MCSNYQRSWMKNIRSTFKSLQRIKNEEKTINETT